MSDHSELKRLAEAATPGPWAYDGSYVCPARTEDGTTYVELWRSIADCHQPENTKFIAAANPAAVLALIAEVEALRKDAERWRFFNAVANDLQAFPHSWGLMTKEKMDFMCDEAMDADRKGNEP